MIEAILKYTYNTFNPMHKVHENSEETGTAKDRHNMRFR